MGGRIPNPAYAIDDQTAIKVSDGTVEVISEGHWKLFSPYDRKPCHRRWALSMLGHPWGLQRRHRLRRPDTPLGQRPGMSLDNHADRRFMCFLLSL